jgi:hypothetical protein
MYKSNRIENGTGIRAGWWSHWVRDWYPNGIRYPTGIQYPTGIPVSGLQIEGLLAYFTHINRQKRIEDDVGEVKYVLPQKKLFLGKWPPDIFIHLIMQEYDSKCLKMHIITLKVFKICTNFWARITKVNEGESNTPCLAHWKWHTPQVEKLSKALQFGWDLWLWSQKLRNRTGWFHQVKTLWH